MKKVLLATSALTMVAGAAFADASISANGRMGVVSTGGTTGAEYRYQVHFNGSTTTDSGITFGAFARYRTGGNNGTAYNAGGVIAGGRVWVSNGTLTLTLGNQSGSVTDMTGFFGCAQGYRGANCRDTITAYANNFGHSSTGNQGVNYAKVQASFGNISLSMSDGTGAGADTEIAANFAAGSVNVGVAYDSGTGANGGTYLGVTGSAGGIGWRAAYGQIGGGTTNWVLAGTYGMGAGSIYAWASSTGGTSSYGITYKHDLGGATAAVGYESIGGTGTTEAGLSFSF